MSVLLKILMFLFVVLVFLAGVFALGPRPALDYPTLGAPLFVGTPANVVEQLNLQNQSVELRDQGCAARLKAAGAAEAFLPRPVPLGTGPLSLENVPQQTPISVVYLHGFSACPQDLHPTLDLVADSLKANLLQFRLTGHGVVGDGLSLATATDWLRDTRRAIEMGRALGKEVVLAGMPTGATLALLSALRDSEGVAAVVALSPNFAMANPSARILTLPWGLRVAEWITGSRRHKWEAESDIRRRLWTTEYDLAVAAEVQLLVEEAQKADWKSWGLPVLSVVSEKDTVVDLERARVHFDEMEGPKKWTTLPGSVRHELAGNAIESHLSPSLAEVIVDFLREQGL